MINLIIAPYRFQQGIGEPQCHEILHRLLTQVVIDAKHLGLCKHRADGFVDCRGRFQRVADRFFQDDARVMIDQAGNFQVVGDGHKQVWCGGQVVDPRQSARFAEKTRQTHEVSAL
ncbi:hypothetical protein D3C72_1369480 [compost metagenome]